MNLAQPILDRFKKKQVPNIEAGDVVRVHQKISEGGKERVQVFEGIVIATHEKSSLDATFTVRKIASGVGVERTYLVHSPNVVKIEFKRSSKVRRSKLYYLRDLVGKALRMKDRKGVVKDNWEFVAEGATETEPSAEEIAEAVEADKAKQDEGLAETDATATGDGEGDKVEVATGGDESTPVIEETPAEEGNHNEETTDQSDTTEPSSETSTADAGDGAGDKTEPTP